MIIRIVKMTFRAEEVTAFINIFNQSKHQIRNFSGCKHLSLLHQTDHPYIIFTYSHWESPQHLLEYRNSELFRSTWKATKALFLQQAEAWSLHRVEEVISTSDKQ